VSVLVVAQSSSEIPEGLMNNPVLYALCHVKLPKVSRYMSEYFHRKKSVENNCKNIFILIN